MWIVPGTSSSPPFPRMLLMLLQSSTRLFMPMHSCFEVFGFDFLPRSNGEVVVLEVRGLPHPYPHPVHSPSCTPTDTSVNLVVRCCVGWAGEWRPCVGRGRHAPPV